MIHSPLLTLITISVILKQVPGFPLNSKLLRSRRSNSAEQLTRADTDITGGMQMETQIQLAKYSRDSSSKNLPSGHNEDLYACPYFKESNYVYKSFWPDSTEQEQGQDGVDDLPIVTPKPSSPAPLPLPVTSLKSKITIDQPSNKDERSIDVETAKKFLALPPEVSVRDDKVNPAAGGSSNLDKPNKSVATQTSIEVSSSPVGLGPQNMSVSVTSDNLDLEQLDVIPSELVAKEKDWAEIQKEVKFEVNPPSEVLITSAPTFWFRVNESLDVQGQIDEKVNMTMIITDLLAENPTLAPDTLETTMAIPMEIEAEQKDENETQVPAETTEKIEMIVNLDVGENVQTVNKVRSNVNTTVVQGIGKGGEKVHVDFVTKTTVIPKKKKKDKSDFMTFVRSFFSDTDFDVENIFQMVTSIFFKLN